MNDISEKKLVKGFKAPDREVIHTVFRTVTCTGCKTKTARHKWYERKFMGQMHTFAMEEHTMTAKDCPECTRRDAINRAHKIFNDKVQDQLLREKELLTKIREEKEEGNSEERSTKRQKPSDGTDVTTSSDIEEDKSKGSPDKMIEVRFAEVENLFWDPERHSLVKKDENGRVCGPYESLPVFPKPEDLVLNVDSAMITRI